MTLSVNSTYNTGENIVINWTASANATKYGLTVWKAPYTTDQYAVWDNYVTGTSKDIGTLPAGSYLVQMKPYNSAGGGPNTNIASFSVTAPAATVQPVVTVSPTALPGAMTLSVNATYKTGEDIVINWAASTNATKYGLTVWKAPYTTDQYAVWDHYVTGISKDVGALPAGNYCVAMKPYNSAGGGPGSNVAYFSVTTATQSVPKSSGGDYYVLFMNDMDLNVAGTKLGEAVGHVGLFFYTTDRTNSGLNYYFSYGSYQPNGILEGLITKTILADTKIFRGNSSTDYASYLKNKGYDRFIAFKISSRDLYMKMMGKAIDLAGIANVYDLATNNCFQNACKVMSVDSQYFNMWTSGNAVLDIGLEPDNAFDTIANYYKTSPIYIDKINSNNFTSTIVSDSIRDN
ncbi:hypothetical protein DSOL_5290 [Desulfosporosinus metallidurans]|uniref:Fibronectin type-III domain-containing protein n=2 Tax=Desulfosporosinus metallidurans TaxID=1888891 RepID=A0A1Q8QE22_9FIRM|nr:hypothetical protein DSOL_5290 [Desulfosporosinus metallidurans]